jgi:hypothetical protein
MSTVQRTIPIEVANEKKRLMKLAKEEKNDSITP